ncbi:hypothetical protein MKEN_00838400 [Mycena kentingensis (nom. inval.)]|nr:hypothetical protein MKEN_00838400 [Mycena kentingensis (nom. inval.)]
MQLYPASSIPRIALPDKERLTAPHNVPRDVVVDAGLHSPYAFGAPSSTQQAVDCIPPSWTYPVSPNPGLYGYLDSATNSWVDVTPLQPHTFLDAECVVSALEVCRDHAARNTASVDAEHHPVLVDVLDYDVPHSSQAEVFLLDIDDADASLAMPGAYPVLRPSTPVPVITHPSIFCMATQPVPLSPDSGVCADRAIFAPKPRCLAMERAWKDVLERFEAQARAM